MAKHKLDLELILPTDAGDCAACIDRLLSSVRGQLGVTTAHVVMSQKTKPKLCLHYDPARVDRAQLESLVGQAGAALRASIEHISTPVGGLRHERQAKLVEAFFAGEPGVIHASVAFGAKRLTVAFDPTRTSRPTLLGAADRAGVTLVEKADGPNVKTEPESVPHSSGDGHDHVHGGLFGERTELVFSLTCGALTGIGWAISRTGVSPLVSTGLFIAAYVLGAWFTVQEVVLALRAKRFEIDFLMLLAAIGAAVLGEWFEGALLLFLFTLGHSLEAYAMSRARNAIEALSELVPATAHRVDSAGWEREIAVAELLVGDRVRVKPNTRLPADGFVVEGNGSVNQAPITGESIPVDKRPAPDAEAASKNPEALAPEHRVFAGTINGSAVLTVAVTKGPSDSTLARVVKMVAEAENQKSPTQVFTDRFERVFVPIILGVIGILLFAWAIVDEPFSRSFYRAMAVLVAASPCALAIATPSAVLSGVARAARGGVLIKGGAHLESLGLVNAVAFDKTGTLTEGKPVLTEVLPATDVSDVELLSVALAVEKQSDHPLAIAIVNGAASRLPASLVFPEATAVEGIVAFGVRATIAGSPVLIGKPGLFTRDGPMPEDVGGAVESLQAAGRSVMVVKLGDRFLGAVGVMDTPRPSARAVVAELHRLGIEQTIMLTGDHQRVADAVARDVGIRTARGDLLPEQKVSAIQELARSSTRVAMVGDGVNDAPAMANATVGITMGAGGSDVALETADVALMADDLRALPFAIGLSRAARSIIRQNLWASLGMVAFLIPATIFGFAGIGVAVALHEGSTLLVVANALRLLAYADRREGLAEPPDPRPRRPS